ncbi:ABC transporter substrate-binding protein [Fusobacterium ulcerans]|jgi:iron complex transport system substrate-binding protein|uniref:ABC transporter substrate-binding protein n=1 Tax=Fusobacterium ulcerans TaxID=861 RepID=UPI001D09C31F|nr:ABC transporter substrate-binding protein [Fusobacterium ulcerans]MCB8564299.1 ABC transporter substrate-binding protein [Fusobacterium ulcerans]MCB8648113.1 ABC transporter substrate-binding protein [Fusobacterium ulcerans]
MKKIAAILLTTFSTMLFAFTNSQEINGVKYDFNFDKAPQRAVSMSQFTTEIMLKLGLKGNMAGTAFLEEEIYPSVASDYKEVPVLADKWPSLEELLAADPDFVTGWEVAFKKGVDSKMIVKNKINMFVPQSSIDFNADLDTLFNDFLMFGKIFNKEKEAQDYVNSEKARVEKIKKSTAGKKEFTYFIYDSGTDKAFTVFEGFTPNLLKLINGKNILSDKGVEKTWGETSWEDVIAADPDYFIIVDYSTGIREETDSESKIKAIKANPKLNELKAVKNDKFIRVKLAEIVPGIRNVDFFEKVAKEVYQVNE